MRNTRRAFTIIEVIVIVVIIGVIAAVVTPRLFSKVTESKKSMAQSNAATLFQAMQTYSLDCGMPEPGSSIRILLERPSNVDEGAWKGPYVQNENDLKDPWGNYFNLVVPGQFNVDFDIVSYGKDGQPDGEGENEDIISGKR
ncbi:MAG TPA: type II secretion system major pseudopilin GspG [Phycisphaerales bacterium]|nr:type II secretion system major pseudopilin GspG [Phycisphaerales bacterium]